MPGTQVRYAYRPLKEKEIRIIRLLPGAIGEEIQCTIEHVILQTPAKPWVFKKRQLFDFDILNDDRLSEVTAGNCECPRYEALSYVWGPQDCLRFLTVNGKTSGLLSIGPNLYDALEQLRPSPGQNPRILWVDQICINQADLAERGVQVRNMKSIFQSARKVLIWLGPEDEFTKLAFGFARTVFHLRGHQFMWKLDVDIDQIHDEFVRMIPRKYAESNLARKSAVGVANETLAWCVAAIHRITYNTWFQRTWTFQELKVAQQAELISGSQRLPWVALSRILSYPTLRYWHPSPDKGLELTNYSTSSENWEAFSEKHDGGLTFRTLMAFRTGSKCSDARDRVIALLGLADDLHEVMTLSGSKTATEFICPSYQEPVERLYTKTAQYLIQSSLSLDLLRNAVHTDTRCNLPSWVPDWRLPASSKEIASEMHRQATKGSSYPRWFLESRSDITKLRTGGIKQDRIRSTRRFDDEFAIEFFLDHHVAKLYAPTMQPMDVAVKQMLMRSDWGKTDQPARAAYLGLESKVNSDPSLQGIVPTFDEQVASLNRRFNTRDPGLYMFRGCAGFIGYCTTNLRVGDEIHLLLGLDVPAILRPVNESYSFVGLCYVHGLMYGEGIHRNQKPLPCNYPGSNKIDEYWTLSRMDMVKRNMDTDLYPEWQAFQSKEEAVSYFRDRYQELLKDEFIRSPHWTPFQWEFGEKSIWLLERGSDPMLIQPEEVVLI